MVNSVGIKCKRTIEEVKKKWQDAQSSIKKKEGERLKSSRLTGGGPAPDISFKPLEKVNYPVLLMPLLMRTSHLNRVSCRKQMLKLLKQERVK